MKNFDGDVQFNRGQWSDLITTQAPLFSVERLTEISEQLRSEFYGGHEKGREMPVIGRSDCCTSLLDRYAHTEIGYDLPCLISAERPSKGRVMMCAQDPLRRGENSGVTVGTFFGIDNPYYRARRHWRMIWQLIRACVSEGYDVWVTDAIKVYAGPNVLRKDMKLRELCFGVLQHEVQAVEPVKILAFGADAKHALSSASIDNVLSVPHPTSRGIRGSMAERLERYKLILEIN